MRHGVLCPKELRQHVDAEDPGEVSLVELLNRSSVLNACVLAEGIEAPQPSDALCDQRFDISFLSNVARNEANGTAELFQGRSPLAVGIAHNHSCAFGDKGGDGCTTNVRDTTGYDDPFASQPLGHFWSPRSLPIAYYTIIAMVST
jgi:hypothetical protein